MTQDEIAAMFRGQELQRRSERRQLLLNEAALAGEPLDDLGVKATEQAIASIQRQEREYQSLIRPKAGYWHRLWLAILGKEPK